MSERKGRKRLFSPCEKALILAAMIVALTGVALTAGAEVPPPAQGLAVIEDTGVPTIDVRNFVAHTYIRGVLSTDPARVSAIPRILGIDPGKAYSFIWALRIARPATSWIWGQAVLESLGGEDPFRIVVNATVPDAWSLIRADESIPRSVREWRAIESIAKTPPDKRVSVTREIRIRPDGTVDVDGQDRRGWLNTPFEEIREALSWCDKNFGEAPEDYILDTWEAVRASSLIELPPDVRIALEALAARIDESRRAREK